MFGCLVNTELLKDVLTENYFRAEQIYWIFLKVDNLVFNIQYSLLYVGIQGLKALTLSELEIKIALSVD